MAPPVNIVLGVIGADCHAVANKILEMVFREAGFRVENIGVMVSQDEFIAAAIETAAEAILVSSLYGHGEMDCRGLRQRCVEAGIGNIILYVGGNLVVGKSDFAPVERTFLDMGFDRVFRQGRCPRRAWRRSRRTCGSGVWSLARYLLGDVGSTFTKLLVVETDGPVLLAAAAAPTTVGTDLNEGFDAALAKLDVPTDACRETLVSSSAAGGLRIAAVGLVPELTMKAASLAALGAGGTVVGAFSFTLTEDDRLRLEQLHPDLVLLAGGTDGGDSGHIAQNARRLAAWLPKTPVVVAGNRTAYDELRGVFAGRADVHFTANVLPDLKRMELDPARGSIRAVFLERIVESKGLTRLRSRARVVMPTPEAVLQAVSLLAKGHAGVSGLGELLTVDVGGATTDVYSCADGRPEREGVVLRGVPEPFHKRTVEADIGMRHTLPQLMEKLDLDRLARDNGLDAAALSAWVETVVAQPDRLPADTAEARMDTALAAAGCAIAVERHSGRLEETFTPEGRIFVQEGKDLGRVKWVIGTGE